jgi:hypothetical protein
LLVRFFHTGKNLCKYVILDRQKSREAGCPARFDCGAVFSSDAHVEKLPSGTMNSMYVKSGYIPGAWQKVAAVYDASDGA